MSGWFRVYSDILHSPKLLVLPEAWRWRYLALLALHNEHDHASRGHDRDAVVTERDSAVTGCDMGVTDCRDATVTCRDDEIAAVLHITLDEWIETRNAFIMRGLLNADGSIKGCKKRQFISDKTDKTAAERVMSEAVT